MDNPYSTPRSDLDAGMPKLPRKRFWKFLFWLHVVLSPFVALALVASPTLSVLDMIDAATLLPILLVLYAYSYNRAIFRQAVWKVAAVVYPLWFVAYDLVLPLGFGTLNYGQPVEAGPLLAVPLAFGGVLSAAFILYAFRSRDIWQDA